MTRNERQSAILRLVEEEQLSTQADVTRALREQGFDAVQATVSRDIAQLGLVKVRNGSGRLVYARPGSNGHDRTEQLSSALRRWVSGMKHAGPLLVIATPSGFAAPLADAIDAASLDEVAGTIAGENTVFVAVSDGTTAAAVEEQFRKRLEGAH